MKTNRFAPKIEDKSLSNWLQQLRDDVGASEQFIPSIKFLNTQIVVNNESNFELGKDGYTIIGAIPVLHSYPIKTNFVKLTTKNTVLMNISIDGATSDTISFILIAK